MKLAMTIMVRDEADVLEAMLHHHAAQGVSVFIVTDNGSVDGTGEILRRFSQDHDVDLRHDPVHRKQQGQTVTRMARDAASIHGADWVINADADEFWTPVDRSITLGDAFAGISPSLQSFTVPVTDLVGHPAESGTGLSRLVWRDTRPTDEIAALGMHAHATADCAHIADPDILVHQGNHFVSLASQGSPPAELAIEVLHLPWRSWAQVEQKVMNAGRAYDANPELTPSANHHGMRDYRRLQLGYLKAVYVRRHPSDAELADGIDRGWFTRDDLLAGGSLPSIADELIDDAEAESLRDLAVPLLALEQQNREIADEMRAAVKDGAAARDEADALRADRDRLAHELHAIRTRRVVRLADRIGRALRR